MSLHKNKLPYQIVKRMETGEKKTISEWAESLGISYDHLCMIFTGLRKKGWNFHPHPSGILVKGVQRTGIVVDIMKKENWLREGINSYEDRRVLPSIVGSFRIIEAGIEAHPRLALELQSYVDNLQGKLIEFRKKSLAAKKLQLTEGKK